MYVLLETNLPYELLETLQYAICNSSNFLGERPLFTVWGVTDIGNDIPRFGGLKIRNAQETTL